ncbi:MAG: YlbF family regulator [Ruminiclostridium sp.]|nr:YlbF family regulator [Ruminiclostridium sp.]
MDALHAARELGKAIQADPRYKDYVAAKEANDADEELQKLISAFSAKRAALQTEMSKEPEEQDGEKIRTMNKEMQDAYGEVMKNVNMANFAVVKNAFDILLNEVNMIISMSCEGEDPDTCDPHASHGCGGSCATCGGCG